MCRSSTCRSLFLRDSHKVEDFWAKIRVPVLDFSWRSDVYDRQLPPKLRRNSLFRVLRKVWQRTQSISLAVSTNFVTNYVSFELGGITAGTGTISIPLKATFRFCSHEWNEKPHRVTFWRITGRNKNTADWYTACFGKFAQHFTMIILWQIRN